MDQPASSAQRCGDTFQDKDRIGRETYKLLAIVDLRDQILTWLPGSRFLPPTSIDTKAVVGLHSRPKTWIAAGNDIIEAYCKLDGQTVG